MALVIVYLGLVVLSAMPFANEVVTDTSGGFGFVWMMLATAPLSFVIIGFLVELPDADRMLANVLLAAAIVVPALVNAWIVWRIFRGPVVAANGSPS